MTNLAALQSLTTFRDTALFEKILLDRGVTGTAAYTASGKENIDLCLADLYIYLSTHPVVKEGSRTITYSSSALKMLAETIYRKYDDSALHGVDSDGDAKGSVDGTPQW